MTAELQPTLDRLMLYFGLSDLFVQPAPPPHCDSASDHESMYGADKDGTRATTCSDDWGGAAAGVKGVDSVEVTSVDEVEVTVADWVADSIVLKNTMHCHTGLNTMAFELCTNTHNSYH